MWTRRPTFIECCSLRMTGARPGHCVKCKAGADCNEGATIETMDVLPGFYRFDNNSYNVYECESVRVWVASKVWIVYA